MLYVEMIIVQLQFAYLSNVDNINKFIGFFLAGLNEIKYVIFHIRWLVFNLCNEIINIHFFYVAILLVRSICACTESWEVICISRSPQRICTVSHHQNMSSWKDIESAFY